MQIGPRTDEAETPKGRFWTREINGTRYLFTHVKVSRFGPRFVVTRARGDRWYDVHRFTA